MSEINRDRSQQPIACNEPEPKRGSDDDLPNRPFMFSGFQTPTGAMLCWGGTPTVAGLAGYNLWSITKGPGGDEWVKLNDERLPVGGGVFFDTRHASLPQLVSDPFAPIFEVDPERELVESPNALDIWLDLLSRGRMVPLREPLEPGPAQAPDGGIPDGSYCLIGEYIGGERDGVVPFAAKGAKWTPAQIRTRNRVIQWALREIRRRGLVAKLTPNLNASNYARLMANVTVVGDCGQLGPGTQGRTRPAGVAVPGTKRAKSRVTLNGQWLIDLPPNDTLVALVLHELSHALQYFDGVGTVAANLVDGSAANAEGEATAYGAIWDRIQAGDLVYTPAQKCAEIADAVRAMVGKFEELAKAIVDSGANPTAAQRAKLRAVRTSIRQVLLKYQTFLGALPAANPPRWMFRHKTGTNEGLADVVNRLLTDVFRAP